MYLFTGEKKKNLLNYRRKEEKCIYLLENRRKMYLFTGEQKKNVCIYWRKEEKCTKLLEKKRKMYLFTGEQKKNVVDIKVNMFLHSFQCRP